MKKLIIISSIILTVNLLQGQIIHIPSDYPTIQQGIDAASTGDTVLVDTGTYVENINFNEKNITVASRYLTTLDTSFISQTIIDGNQNGCVVIINDGILCGFTILNGSRSGISFGGYYPAPILKNLIIKDNISEYAGGGVRCFEAYPILEDVIITNNTAMNGIGGGIFAQYSSFTLENVTITNNTATDGGGIGCMFFSSSANNVIIANNTAYNGGGIYLTDNAELTLEGVTITNNTASNFGGGICSYECYYGGPIFNSVNRCNIYNNKAAEGNDFYSDTTQVVFLDTFTVQYPTDFHASPLSNFSFNILHGMFDQVDADLFVSPEGNDTNSGLTIDDPLKTIHHAMKIIAADSLKKNTVFLKEGIYSASLNDDFFPLGIPDYINLEGVSGSNVILDAENSGHVIHISNNNSSQLKDITITGGHGIYGGGIYCNGSNLLLENLTIAENQAELGGGIYCVNSLLSFDSINRSNIYLNSAIEGNDLYSDTFQEVVLDTFSVLYPTEFHASPLPNFSFDILIGKVEQVDTDLFVSPSGDNNNSGLSADEPLKTLHHAFSFIRADSLHQNSINLLEGIYSHSSNEEIFPIVLPDYISIAGVSDTTVILDAEGSSNVFKILGNSFNNISGITITGGYEIKGGGIYCSYSNPKLENIIISNNISRIHGWAYGGGGVFCDNSSPLLQDVIISNNSAGDGGGIYCYLNSHPTLINVQIDGNSADFGGGGILCRNYSNPTLQNVIISGNSAGFGGGVVFSESNTFLENVLIVSNTAGKGGTMVSNSSNLTLKNTTISDNSAYSHGGISCLYGSNLYLINSICWGDSLEEIAFYDEGDPNSIEILYSDIEGGEEGIVTNNNGTINWLDGNLNEDPLFFGSDENPYELSGGSPCIDAGTPDTNGLNVPFGDIIGNLRIWDGDNNGTAVIDMGAYEYGSVPVNIKEPIKKEVNDQTELKIFPNPFYQSTVIELEFEEKRKIELSIYNQLGERIETIFEGDKDYGIYQLTWNSSNLPSGIYFIKLLTDKGIKTQKMIKK